jgi:hypothetical protein
MGLLSLKLYCFSLGAKDICNKLPKIPTPPSYLDTFINKVYDSKIK